VLAGLSLWLPAALPDLPGAAVAALLIAAVAVHGRLTPRLAPPAARPAAVAAAAAGLAATLLGVLAVRP
jgi:hypothetical protein